jgi:hypothetical protein
MISAQLSLFDTAAVIKPAYNVGDRVKLRKKPIAASYVKKGDIVEIAAVHPINGSVKFWNERSERWESVYPDEIGSILKSVDSVTPVEVAVTESTPEPATDNSVTPVEVAVTESTPEPAADDSVTPVEVAVTESTPEPAADNSVTPVEVAVTESTPQPAADNSLNAISTYSPRGTARGGSYYRGGQYYRLSYREGARVRHQHIRGGNTDSPMAQAKVREVRSLLAAGIPPAQIAAMLRQPEKTV